MQDTLVQSQVNIMIKIIFLVALQIDRVGEKKKTPKVSMGTANHPLNSHTPKLRQDSFIVP